MYETRIRIDDELGDELKIISKKEKRSINGQIEYIIEKYIEVYKENHSSLFPQKPNI